MAIWQFQCNIIPMRENFEGLSYDEIITWKDVPQPVINIDFLENEKSWSTDIILYGKMEETCIEFYYDKNELDEICCRLDLRSLTKDIFIKIIKYVEDIGAGFLIDEKIYQPQLEIIRDIMKQSTANQYCKNPLEYFMLKNKAN